MANTNVCKGKTLKRFAFGAALTSLSISAIGATISPAVASWDAGALVYQNTNYQGDVLPILPGQSIPNLSSIGWNDKISSLQVAPGCTLYAFLDKNYIPSPPVIYSSSNNVSNSYNDQFSSLALNTCSYSTSYWKVAAFVYEDTNYGGAVLPIFVGQPIPKLSSKGWNDRISSIKVAPNCVLNAYLDSNYIPSPPIVYSSGNYSSLGSRYSDKISSLGVSCTK
jgi:hypothetical protein